MSDFAMKYHMGKKMGKCAHGMGSDCSHCYAEGGFTEGGVHKPIHGSSTDPKRERGSGMSMAGEHVRGANMAKAAGQHKAHASRMESAKKLHKQNHEELKSMDKPHLYAQGGEADSDSGFSDDMVGRIMKHRFAKGGEVEPLADFESNDFDVSDKEPAEEFSYTGTNSGDELGDKEVDEDEKDIVKRAMKARKK